MMSSHSRNADFLRLAAAIAMLFALFSEIFPAMNASASQKLASPKLQDPVTGNNIYIPQVLTDHPWISPFGIESTQSLLDGDLITKTVNLDLGYVRLGSHISWATLQPAPGVPINWDLLANLDEELRQLKQTGITPIVVVKDTPVWAQKPGVRDDGQPTSCGPIDTQFFDEFASFVQQLVNRYKTTEFDVHIWELGNEPDVDSNLVPPDYAFGCWGDVDDEDYYGGYHYGQMINVVGPAIRQADPTAQVWIGGLLLDRPDSDEARNKGYPEHILQSLKGSRIPSNFNLFPWVPLGTNGYSENFLNGILESGAAPNFDVVPYHVYSTFWDEPGGPRYDWDTWPDGLWSALGGGVIGKARFLRQIMAQYGIDKPVFLNETGFACMDINSNCKPPIEEFYDSKATHLVRFYVRSISEDVSGTIWYTLNGPGWRYTGLLDGNQQPGLAYSAYQVLTQQLQYARYLGRLDYADGIEAYAFRRNSELVHVVWAEQDTSIIFYVPADKFIQMVDRQGNVMPISPPPVGADYELQAGFDPIYVIRKP